MIALFTAGQRGGSVKREKKSRQSRPYQEFVGSIPLVRAVTNLQTQVARGRTAAGF